MTWHVVYHRESGEAFSIGTVLADPMPPQFAVQAITDAEAEAINAGAARWDAQTRAVVAV
jgi:hypothetical protein